MAFIIPLRKEQIFTEKSGMKPTPIQLKKNAASFVTLKVFVPFSFVSETCSRRKRKNTPIQRQFVQRGVIRSYCWKTWLLLSLCTVGALHYYATFQKKERALKDKYILTLITLLFGQPLRENIYLRVDELSLAHYCLFAVAKHKILSKFSTLQNKRQRGSTGSTTARE